MNKPPPSAATASSGEQAAPVTFKDLRGNEVVRLSDYVRQNGLSAPSVTNAARCQTAPTFREEGVWKIGQQFSGAPDDG